MAQRKDNRTIVYRSFDDDVVQSSEQDYQLPEDYVWIRDNWASGILYTLFRFFAWIYCKLILGIRVENRHILDACTDTGFFLFANHTQPVGDALIPICVNRSRRISVIVSPANLGIPVLGKLLPYLGALPVSHRRRDLVSLNHAVEQRIQEKQCVVIYPEAHVWPYYTKIRPFPATSFHYPVAAKVPTYCMTTTYRKRCLGSRPKITVYLDGPFWPDPAATRQAQKEDLRVQVHACMEKRSQNSNYEYYHYVEEEIV